jgi:hypothetical protein
MSWMLSMKTAASQLAAVTNRDVGSEEALASPDVEDLLASGRTKQVQDGRDRQPSMIRAAPVADPAVIQVATRFQLGQLTPRPESTFCAVHTEYV